MATDKKFYIWARDKGPVGNDALFWRPDSAGYTTDIDEAGVYSEQEARRICRGGELGDAAIPVESVNASTHRSVDWTIAKRALDEKWDRVIPKP